MRAKTLNLNSDRYKHFVMNVEDRTQKFTKSTILTRVLVRLNYKNDRFEIVEAYMKTSERIEGGNVTEILPFLNRVTNEWYNATLEPISDRIFAEGFVSIINNYRYEKEYNQLADLIAIQPTNKQRRKGVTKNVRP